MLNPYMIYSDSNALGGLEDIGGAGQSLSAYYELANNIDASETLSWGSGASAGFNPVGNFVSKFAGTFNGN